MPGAHPRHTILLAAGIPIIPARLPWLRQWWRERLCRKQGGHWWHSGRTGLFCCQCGRKD